MIQAYNKLGAAVRAAERFGPAGLVITYSSVGCAEHTSAQAGS